MRSVTTHYIVYPGLKYIWYDGSIIRPCDSGKVIHCIHSDGTIVYYDQGGLRVRSIKPNGEIRKWKES